MFSERRVLSIEALVSILQQKMQQRQTRKLNQKIKKYCLKRQRSQKAENYPLSFDTDAKSSISQDHEEKSSHIEIIKDYFVEKEISNIHGLFHGTEKCATKNPTNR